MIAIEITAAIDYAGQLKTFYFADARFVTSPTDTPANTVFDETVLDPGSISLSAFGDGRVGGGTKLALGEMRLANGEGQYDAWVDYGFDGQRVVIRQGPVGGAYPATFTNLFTGTIETLTVNETEIIVRLRDKQLIFDRPVLVNAYLGDNIAPNGVEGTVDDLKGQPKPRLYGGPAREIAPLLVNAPKQVYQAHDGGLAALGPVYDQGVALTTGADYSTVAALLSATVASGAFATCVSAGLFKLGAAPAGQVTCDASQGSTTAQRTAAQLIKALALEAGVPLAEISASDIATLDAANPSPLALWLSDQTTYSEAMDRIAESVGAYYAFDGNGILRMGRLEAPAGQPVLSLFSDDFIKPGPQRKPLKGGDLPSWSYTIRHSRIYTVQTTSLAGAVTPARRAFLANEWRAAKASDATVLNKHTLAIETVVDSLFTSEAEAQTEAGRRLALFSARADLFDVTVPAAVLSAQTINLIDPAGLTHDRFGMDTGRLFRLLGVRLELLNNRAVVSVWGAPTPLPPPLVKPENTAPPVISGSAIYGSILTSTVGTWTANPAPSFTYQWKRNGVAIGGATASTYTTVFADAGKSVTCTVTATNALGATPATSNAIAVTSFLEADITIIAKAGQSNSLGQNALPMPARTARDFAQMLDTNKPGTSSGTFGSTLTQAVGQEYIFGGTNHQGDTFDLAIADKLEKLIEDLKGVTYATHGKQVIVVDFGLSSSDVPGFGYGSAHFTRVLAWCTAVKAAATALGKTIRFGGLAWAWGAYAYVNNIGQASASAKIQSYCGPTGDLATYVLPIFGQTGEVIPVGFLGSHHHYQATDPLTPFVAMAEQALVAADPSRYSHIDGEGIHHLNGLDFGLGESLTHLHPNEEEEEAGLVAWWAYTKIVKPVGVWPDMIPTFARGAGLRQLVATLPNFPAGAFIGFRGSGLTPTSAQPNHGWFICDPTMPTVEVPLARPPYPGATAGTIIFDTTADLPTPLEVRYGARDASHLNAGNTVIYFTSPITTPIQGVATALSRSMPAMKVQVA